MLSLPPSVRVFIARDSADMRKGFDGLEGLTREVIRQDPLSGHLFVFFNRKRDRVKILVWDRSGFMLLYKRLEQGRFGLGAIDFQNDQSAEVLASDLALLLDGIDLRGAKRQKRFVDRRQSGISPLVH